jgi:hypothetical protein
VAVLVLASRAAGAGESAADGLTGRRGPTPAATARQDAAADLHRAARGQQRPGGSVDVGAVVLAGERSIWVVMKSGSSGSSGGSS